MYIYTECLLWNSLVLYLCFGSLIFRIIRLRIQTSTSTPTPPFGMVLSLYRTRKVHRIIPFRLHSSSTFFVYCVLGEREGEGKKRASMLAEIQFRSYIFFYFYVRIKCVAIYPIRHRMLILCTAIRSFWMCIGNMWMARVGKKLQTINMKIRKSTNGNLIRSTYQNLNTKRVFISTVCYGLLCCIIPFIQIEKETAIEIDRTKYGASRTECAKQQTLFVFRTLGIITLSVQWNQRQPRKKISIFGWINNIGYTINTST